MIACQNQPDANVATLAGDPAEDRQARQARRKSPANGKENAKEANPRGTLPTVFTPRLLKDADARFAVVRELRERTAQLSADCGAESFQRRALVDRAVFMLALLETAEVDAMEGVKPLDVGQYVQACNALLGLLKTLGLDRKVKPVGLAEYVEARK